MSNLILAVSAANVPQGLSQYAGMPTPDILKALKAEYWEADARGDVGKLYELVKLRGVTNPQTQVRQWSPTLNGVQFNLIASPEGKLEVDADNICIVSNVTPNQERFIKGKRGVWLEALEEESARIEGEERNRLHLAAVKEKSDLLNEVNMNI